jgi:formylglycine-generating enzyme required for sulfatase activity
LIIQIRRRGDGILAHELIASTSIWPESPRADAAATGRVRHELITGNAGDNGGLIAAARNRVRVVISDHLPHTTTACGSAPSGLTKLSKLLSETVLSDLPVENVSLDDAVEFCKKLSELPEEKKAGRVYHLPTEAQWEYACLAGSKTIYSFDDGEGLLPE